MKYSVILLFFLLACNPEKKNPDEQSNVPNLDWILGKWTRTNGEPEENTSETWNKSENGYNGVAITAISGDTVFQESIKAYLDKGQWHYEVTGPNKIPITFTSTSVTDTSFICENPAHDFPKEISYTKDGECINAIISDSEKEILFRYEKRLN